VAQVVSPEFKPQYSKKKKKKRKEKKRKTTWVFNNLLYESLN
jgi:hypothetical protein